MNYKNKIKFYNFYKKSIINMENLKNQKIDMEEIK